MSKLTAAITGVGGYVPDDVLSNKTLTTMVDTSDEWIFTRTGVKNRRILKKKGKGASYLGVKAIENLMERRPFNIKEVDLVIMSSATKDMPVAISASYLATQIGAINAFSFDLDAGCSGFLYGMSVASAYIEAGRYKKVLLVGAEKMSSIVDYTDRSTCVIFGDGAGAALFEPNFEGLGYQNDYLRSDGTGRDFLKIDAGGSILPTTEKTVREKAHFLKQDGKSVFKYAVSSMVQSVKEVMKNNQLDIEDIDWILFHQANKRIIDLIIKDLEIDSKKVPVNIHNYGNTSSATLPLLLSDFEHEINKGDNIIFTTFGGGFAWGASFYKWAY